MLFVDIDVAKSHHGIASLITLIRFVCIIFAFLVIIKVSQCLFHQALIQLSIDTNDDIHIDIEATGHYHLN